MAILERVRKTDGIKVYLIDFRDQAGRRVREVAGTTRTQARKALEQRIGEVRAGTYVNPREAARKARHERGPTFADFAADFLRDYGGLRRSLYYQETLREGGAIMEAFGKRPLREITEADLDAFRRDRSRAVGPSTVRKNLTVLGTMFRMARRWGVLDRNPAADLEKPPEPRHRVRYLAPEEWTRLHAAAEPWLKPILTMAMCTGARLKEVVGLRWENVDRRGGMLYISEDNKTAVPRQIPLGATARELIEGQVRHLGSPFVFVTDTGHDYTSARQRNRVSQRTRAAMVAAGIEGASFHTLRHTVGSWLGQHGYSETQIGALLGHAAATVTGRYVHFQADALRGMVSTLDCFLRGGHPGGHSQGVALVSG